MNCLYPISLNLKDKLCIVIGGGKIALRKVHRLLKSGAIVKVIAPTFDVGFKQLKLECLALTLVEGEYSGRKDLKNASLIFATTNSSCLNKKICHDARALGILVNVASEGSIGDFLTPATLQQGDLQISISTSGKVPGISKAIKEDLKVQFNPNYAILIDLFEQVRNIAISNLDNKAQNLDMLSNMIQNYTDILKDLDLGVNPDSILDRLIQKL